MCADHYFAVALSVGAGALVCSLAAAAVVDMKPRRKVPKYGRDALFRRVRGVSSTQWRRYLLKTFYHERSHRAHRGSCG